MSKDAVLRLLLQETGYVSGEKMSRALGLSRAAVWKHISALREAGYEIEAKTNRGYRLLALPDTPCPEAIRPLLAGETLFSGEIHYLDQVDSTNSQLKRLAEAGAPHGTAVIAGEQTGGRGRMGRGFVSLANKGLFFSLLLRPGEWGAQSLTKITAFSAVAVSEAIFAVSGIAPQIKWVNDLLVEDKKLCGILTEMAVVGEMGQVAYIVIGAGINVHYQPADFPPAIRDRATSLSMLTDRPLSRAKLAAALMVSFARMYREGMEQPETYAARYRALSATVGRDILVLRQGESRPAHALGIDSDCGLLVRYPDGREETLAYGEISIRGVGGYI